MDLITGEHVPMTDGNPDYCAACCLRWPCDVARDRQELAALRARLAESEGREQALWEAVMCSLVHLDWRRHGEIEHTWHCCARKKIGGVRDCSKDCERVRAICAAAQPATAEKKGGAS